MEHANDNLDSLNAWLDQVQGLIANQEDVSEDLGDLQNQIEIMRVRHDITNFLTRWSKQHLKKS